MLWNLGSGTRGLWLTATISILGIFAVIGSAVCSARIGIGSGNASGMGTRNAMSGGGLRTEASLVLRKCLLCLITFFLLTITDVGPISVNSTCLSSFHFVAPMLLALFVNFLAKIVKLLFATHNLSIYFAIL